VSVETGRLGGGAGLRNVLTQHGASILRTYGIVFALVVLIVTVTASNPTFLSSTNIFNMLSQWAPAGIMAIGMTYVILTGGFDLSIAAGYSLCAVTAAALGQAGHDPMVCFLAAIGVGLVLGVANGGLVSLIGINPFIATVGSGFIMSGVTLLITDNKAYIVDDPSFATLGSGDVAGFPYTGMLLIGLMVIGGLILSRTVYGQWIYAVGGNREASRLSGIRSQLTEASTYVVSGLCMGIAGIITASQLSSAQADIDPDIVFDVITIVVVGGTSLAGGIGSMWRSAVGLALIATITNAFSLLDLNPFYQDLAKGIIIVGALALDVWSRRLARRASLA